MGFSEQDAIKTIENLLNFNDYYKIIQVLKTINLNIFSNEKIKNKFKGILINMYNIDDINYLKQLLKEFIEAYYNNTKRINDWFCSRQFRDHFTKLGAIDKSKVIEQINKIIHDQAGKTSIPLGEFIETPHSIHYPVRIIWYRIKEGIFIVDVYNKGGMKNFYRKIDERLINRNSYTNFVPLQEFINV